MISLWQAHGRPTLKNLVQEWNKTLQKELEPTAHVKTDAASAFLASLEEPKLTMLSEAGKKPPIEILPPGMPSLTAPPITIKKSPAGQISSLPQPGKPLMLEAAAPPTGEQPAAPVPGEQPVTPGEQPAAPTEQPSTAPVEAAASNPEAATASDPDAASASNPSAASVNSSSAAPSSSQSTGPEVTELLASFSEPMGTAV